MSALHYDSDDALPRSPGLVAFKPNASPSPSPPPKVTHIYRQLSSPTSSRRKQPSKMQTSLGDTVLLRQMAPNQPEVAREAGRRALNASDSSDGEDGDDKESVSSALLSFIDAHQDRDLPKVAQEALFVGVATLPPPPPMSKPPAPLFHESHRDSVVEAEDERPRNAEAAKPIQLPAHTRQPASPQLRHLTIPPPRASPVHQLPALHTPQSPASGAMGSPETHLPPFQAMRDIAEEAQQERTHRSSVSHRQSISSMGQSPTSIGRQLSITSLASGAYFSKASSPGGSDFQRDPFLPSSRSIFDIRRPSQASDLSPLSAPLPSAASHDSHYPSSDGPSPSSQPSPHTIRGPRMSVDDVLNTRTLPPPVTSAVPAPTSEAGFKCDYPGCSAAPFQTQYLLSSHANVHSQTRSHFCPVAGCARGEGGKGFKRKNEMIRHGLVHQSPGYVCPFCPDREHKYPRPDNLQRHVRVHHLDKDKDDAQLRQVLAQRPEGGSRGRRRRIS